MTRCAAICVRHLSFLAHNQVTVFIGHYGVSFAVKRLAPQTSLGVLFLAVQLLDVVFATFVLAGIEHLRVVRGFTEYNAYDLYYMPYSHSLIGALGWSVLAGVLAAAIGGRKAAPWIAFAVFSHFLLDVPMHTPDMPILGNSSVKIGLGLWRHRDLALLAELVALAVGVWIWRHAPTLTPWPRVRTIAFVGLLFALAVATPFLPPPRDGVQFAWQALTGYVALAVLAGWLDRASPATTPTQGSNPSLSANQIILAKRVRGFAGSRLQNDVITTSSDCRGAEEPNPLSSAAALRPVPLRRREIAQSIHQPILSPRQ
ncbi:MAG TPA: hypothetical protein VGY48_01185 [Vicinamibacterales bacterium]|nr:hypothetical protein [Vicinamibacterales bacterium]